MKTPLLLRGLGCGLALTFLFSSSGLAEEKKELPPGAQVYNDIHAMALSAGNNRVYTDHKDGRLKVLSLEDGKVLVERDVLPPAWDGLAIADGKLFLTTKAGELVCLGD